MDKIFLKYKSTSFNEQFNSPELKSHLGDVESSVFDIKNLIDEMIDAMKGTENIPVFLQESVGFYVGEFLELFDDLYTIVHKPQVDHTSLDRSKTTFSNWHKQCILNQPFQNTPGFLDTYNTIKHFGRRGLREQDTQKTQAVSMEDFFDRMLATEKAHKEIKKIASNKHNSVVNQQRQTAMNSYKLFLESIDEKDKAERYNLMKFLAAAVYEHVNTGFISEKNQPPKSAIVELTKLMQPGSPD